MLKDLGPLVGELPPSLVGTIQIKEKRNPQYPRILERVDFVFEGGPYYHMTKDLISDQEIDTKRRIIIMEGGMRFQIVDFYPDRDIYLVRQDGKIAIAIPWLRRLTQKLDLVYRRLILTAAVWNLATVREGKILSWRDLKWFGGGRDDG